MSRPLACCTLATLLALAGAAPLRADGDPDALPARVHERPARGTIVAQLVFGPRGRTLFAAYRWTARNRPGTDWDACVARWELPSGKRAILRQAIAPLTLSPDGETIAIGSYRRSTERPLRQWPQTELGLWALDGSAPRVSLTRAGAADSSVLATAFVSGGREVVTFNQSGQLLRWRTDSRLAPQLLDQLDPPRGQRRWRWTLAPAALVARAGGEELVLRIPARSVPGEALREIAWRLQATRAERTRDRVLTAAEHADALPVAVSADGGQRATATPDGTIRLVSTTADGAARTRLLRLDGPPREAE